MRTWFLFRSILFLTLICLVTPAASAWTLNNWKASPSGAALPPGTEVSQEYSIGFDSWMTGTTFENDNSLTMYTDLSNPHWTVTKREEMDGQDPIVEEIPVKQGSQVKLEGWALTYSRKQFTLLVKLTGKTPALNQTATISLIRLQEVEPGAKVIKSSIIKKEVQVVVPTPEPTIVETIPVTINMTPAEFIEITAEPTVPATAESPAGRQTYAPGPDPVSIAALLAGLVLVVRMGGRKE